MTSMGHQDCTVVVILRMAGTVKSAAPPFAGFYSLHSE